MRIPVRARFTTSGLSTTRWIPKLPILQDVAKKEHYNNRGLLDNADETAIFLPEGSGDDWGKIAYAKTEDLQEILAKYPQLAGAVGIEATYQSAERAAMDGYEKIFRKSEGVILYAQEGSNHKTTWAEVVGYGEVY